MTDHGMIYAAIALAVGLILAAGFTMDRPIAPLAPTIEASR